MVDCSESMGQDGGSKMNVTKKALKLFLMSLPADSSFSIICYAKKYSLSARIALAKTGAGTRGETDNEIRGIAGVTTVSIEPGSIKVDDCNYYSNINIKF